MRRRKVTGPSGRGFRRKRRPSSGSRGETGIVNREGLESRGIGLAEIVEAKI